MAGEESQEGGRGHEDRSVSCKGLPDTLEGGLKWERLEAGRQQREAGPA